MEEVTYNFKPIDKLVFSDDFMFGAVMREPKIWKGVRLDVYVEGSDRVFDVECQSYREENIGKRTRYYQSMIDMDSLLRGNDYSDLKESYIIFLCLYDPFDKGLPLYTFERKCKENNEVELNDKTHHLIYNCSAYEKEKDGELKDFLTFVKNNSTSSEFTKEIENMVQVKKFENTFINEYLAINLHERDVEKRATQRGLEQGNKAGKLSMCIDLVKSNLLSIKDACLKLGLSEDEFKKML